MKQCRQCLEFIEEAEETDLVWYDEQPHHVDCFKEKAKEEMPKEAAQKVVEHIESGVRHFEIRGEALLPIQYGDEAEPSPDTPQSSGGVENQDLDSFGKTDNGS